MIVFWTSTQFAKRRRFPELQSGSGHIRRNRFDSQNVRYAHSEAGLRHFLFVSALFPELRSALAVLLCNLWTRMNFPQRKGYSHNSRQRRKVCYAFVPMNFFPARHVKRPAQGGSDERMARIQLQRFTTATDFSKCNLNVVRL